MQRLATSKRVCIQSSSPPEALPQLAASDDYQSCHSQSHEDESQRHQEIFQTQTHPLSLF